MEIRTIRDIATAYIYTDAIVLQAEARMVYSRYAYRLAPLLDANVFEATVKLGTIARL